MNKRISTLLVTALVAGGLSANAQNTPTPVKINGITLQTVDAPVGNASWSGQYFVIADLDGSGDATASDVLLKVVASADGKTLTYSGQTLSANTTISNLDQVVWNVGEEPMKDPNGKVVGYIYTLANRGTGTYLTTDKDLKIITDASKSSHDISKGQYARFSTMDGNKYKERFDQKKKLYLYKKDNTTIPNGLAIESSSVSIGNSPTSLILCRLETKTLTAAEVAKLNDVKGGEGFDLKFNAGNEKPWKEGNNILADQKLKAFNVNSITWGVDKMSIPAGVYFATEYPSSLNGKTTIGSKADFDACTFIAVAPTKNYDINAADRKNGIGFELLTVAGSDLNYYNGTDKDQLSTGDEVYVGNACFVIEIPDPMTAPTKYNFKVKNMRVQKDASKEDQAGVSNMYIGVITDQNENYLVTTGTGLKFETANSTIYDVTKLLSTTDAPSIYTIQFVSGADKTAKSEYGQYLTVISKNGQFKLASVEEINSVDPLYQFVISAVDKTTNTVTFKNRQTDYSTTVSLYQAEGEENYTVYATGDVYVENIDEDDKNGDVDFSSTVSLSNTKIVLTPVTVEDKFASFVNRAEGAGLVTFELAKNADATPEFYVGAIRNTTTGAISTGNLLAYADNDEATSFELEKSDKYSFVTNSYVYLKGDRVLTSTVKDTVAYYTYKVKAFDADVDNYYMAITATKPAAKLATSNAATVIIKENIDGSVSLINVVGSPLRSASAQYMDVAAEKDKAGAWNIGANYDLAGKLSVGLKTFMVEESPAISLEAIPQHVSFEAVRGGFMTMDENKDARLAIKDAASEDLTFWVDTVHSDRNIPSFYIVKGGNYLYNAADSAKYYNARGNKRFNVEVEGNTYAKLIFKAGELVSSDTLRTVVDGKSVLVAEKDNAPKKIKGGLADFQYQIIRAEEGSDEYLIRQGGKYVCQYNNYFYLGAKKDQALRFIIEPQSAPTANDDVTVATVKVIAGEGQVTIAGAAGKKVVVSNILGQVVANTVLSSDNATIAAPAGVVVVAVEGEAAVKAVVK